MGLPRYSAGTNGIGGAFAMFAMIDSSSGAASAVAINPLITSALAGSTNIPPSTSSISCSQYINRVTTP
jgi:hypothetical protein